MRRGFTLVEVLVVLAILGIAAAAVAPALARAARGSTPVERSTEEVLRVLRSARKEALQRGVAVTVWITPGSGRYRVVEAVSDGPAPDPVAGGVLALVPDTRLLADPPGASFAFDPLGGGSGGPLTVQGSTGVRVVRVDRWTGEPHVVR
jgi:general secretion pathway protein H